MIDDEPVTKEGWQRFLDENPPTHPEFQYTFRGVNDADTRQSMANAMGQIIAVVSRLFPLQGLDGITIATDYRTALNELDREMNSTEVTEPTVESFGTGMAMSSAVVRDGILKTHVTFEAAIIGGLISDDPEIKDLSTHTFIHELGHVAEHGINAERFGDQMLTPMEDKYEFELYRLTNSCWSEYYASRVSAPWGAHALEGLRELLQGSLEQMVERLTAARAGVGMFNNTQNDQAANEIIDQVSKLMKFAGYVIGHASGEDVLPVEEESIHRDLLEQLDLSDWFDDLVATLEQLYDSREEWDDLSVFHPLHRAFEDACFKFKLELIRDERYTLGWRIYF